MTHSDLGKAVKKMHPVYSSIPDGALGMALAMKHPHLYGGVQPDPVPLPVPETPLQKIRSRVKKHRAGDRWKKPQTPKG